MSAADSFSGLTVEAARRALTVRLQHSHIETPELDARLLLGSVLDLDLTGLATQASRRLTASEAAQLESFTQHRIAGEPVARILGVKEFWGLPLQLSADTLVPRPDTETVVEAALDILRADGLATRPLRIADIGTGSGAILLALLHELPNAWGVGTDISLGALRTARVNAAQLGLAQRSAFVVSDYLAALTGPFDLIVSNPPYICSADIAGLAPEVHEHDPRRALDGGTDGLDAYRAIAGQVSAHLVPGGTLVLEIGQHQGPEVEALLAAAGLLSTAPPKADLGGILRAVAARKPPL
ncbi:MAG TPA: peptide chain release factor N(5)-glutamine methyltransferase [Xanthobacteraceae bacterium]